MATFLDLPPEIRCLIYGHLFAGRNARYEPPPRYTTRHGQHGRQRLREEYRINETRRRDRNFRALFLVSRLSYSEARPAFLKQATLNLTELILADWALKLQPECSILALQVRRLFLDLRKMRKKLSVILLDKSLALMPRIKSLLFDRGRMFQICVTENGLDPYTPDGHFRPSITKDIVERVTTQLRNSYYDLALRQVLELWSRRNRNFELKEDIRTFGITTERPVLDPIWGRMIDQRSHHYRAEVDFGTKSITFMSRFHPLKTWEVSLPGLIAQ